MRQPPVYERIANDVREGIRNGAYPPGSRVPSAGELTAEYGVGSMTARRALGELKRAGLVVAHQGVGHVVQDGGKRMGRQWAAIKEARRAFELAVSDMQDGLLGRLADELQLDIEAVKELWWRA